MRALGAPQTTCTGSPPASTMQTPQPIGVGVRLGLDHARGDEARELGGRVLDALDLEADAGERFDDLGERGLVSRWSLSQERVNFMRFAPANNHRRHGRA